ncbi:hypothetical protein VPHD81_0022 [Vibrio phage D81]
MCNIRMQRKPCKCYFEKYINMGYILVSDFTAQEGDFNG